jgi:hypothetical protein
MPDRKTIYGNLLEEWMESRIRVRMNERPLYPGVTGWAAILSCPENSLGILSRKRI